MTQTQRKMLSLPQLLKQQAPPIFSNPLFASFLPLFVFTIFLLKWLFNSQRSNKNSPPSPSKLPIIGNFHQLGFFPHRSLQSLAQTHGPIMLLQLGSVPALVISSADAAQEIMKTHDIIFSNRPKSSIAERLLYDYKDVSMAPYGEYWRQMKSIYVLQLLSNKRVESFRDVREEETALLVNNINKLSSSSLPVNLSEMFNTLTNDVICRAAFGRKYSEGESGKKFKQLLKDFIKLMGGVDVGEFLPWLAWVNRINGFSAEIDKVAKGLDEFLEGVVEERLNRLKRENYNDGGEVEDEIGRDFFNILLQFYVDNSAGISIDEDCIKAQILIAFAAGADTTSTFLEWAMAELLRNPRVMKEVQNEVREILAGKVDIVEDDLENMKYLKTVIKETLRVHPPFPLLVPREARQDVKVMGYDIAAGTMVITNAWAIGRDPASWVEPEEFRPERFLNSAVDFKGHAFQLVPFGAGRRGCPGTSFAMTASELVLANLVHKFDWALPGGAKVEDLDMTESTGALTRRKFPLLAVATPCSC